MKNERLLKSKSYRNKGCFEQILLKYMCKPVGFL